MKRFFDFVVKRPVTAILAVAALAAAGWRMAGDLAVDVFPDIAVPRVVIQTEAAGLTAEEVEQRVTIPIETAVNGIPGVANIRSSSSGGLSFVWVEFDWATDLARARFDVFERLQRVRETLPPEADAEIAPTVSITGEIMLVALTGGRSPLEVREFAERELRPRLLAESGVGEVVVMGGRLPEYRVSVNPSRLAAFGLTIDDVIAAARDTRTDAGAGYLANVGGDELPLRQIARADSLGAIARASVVTERGGQLRLGDVAEVSLAGAPRRGSASFEGADAVVISVQKIPGGNTPEITRRLDAAIDSVRALAKQKEIAIHTDAYRQADFIGESIAGGKRVVRDAVVVVVAVLALTLFRLRAIIAVLVAMALTIPVSLVLFPALKIGVNVMTLGGFAVAAGDIVDAAIIFAEVVWRRRDLSIHEAMCSVAPGVAFSTLTVAMVFVPLLMLSGLEGAFFRPLALAYLAVFATSLAVAAALVPAVSKLLGRDFDRRGKAAADTAPTEPANAPDAPAERGKSAAPSASAAEGARAANAPDAPTERGKSAAPIKPAPTSAKDPIGMRIIKAAYRPFLALSMRAPLLVLAAALALTVAAFRVAAGFGSSFLPPFHEDSINIALSLPPGASLAEAERVAEAAVPALRAIPGVKTVTRRTGRAERDLHAEPVSSSEYVVRVDLASDVEAIRRAIRERLGGIPGCSMIVGYPIAHRISAVLSGTEAEVAVSVFGEDAAKLRAVVAEMKKRLDAMSEVADVRANREVTVRTLKIEYNLEALAEAGLTLREAGEQVSAAFNGVEVGSVRDGVSIRAVTVRLEGFDEDLTPEAVRSFTLTSRSGRRARLDEVATVAPDEASDLMLRERGRRKALISLGAAAGVDTGRLVERLRAALDPIAEAAGMSVTYGGDYEARASAAKRLSLIALALVVAVFALLAFALKGWLPALLAMLNLPLALVGGIAAVRIADPVLSVSSLVGFVTVAGFVLRNGILLLTRYRELADEGRSMFDAIREGSLERMAPIVMTSLTTVIGLVPIMVAGGKPGGELLAPLAVVQFGGIVGAGVLNLVVLPAAAVVAFRARRGKAAADAAPTEPANALDAPAERGKSAALGKTAPVAVVALAALAAAVAGCKSYEEKPIDFAAEAAKWQARTEIRWQSLEDVGKLALVGNRELNKLRLALAGSEKVARESGWWEDPALEFDLMRIVNPDEYPNILGASLVFTIPLSGAARLESEAAAFYTDAARAEILAAEASVAADARAAAVKVLTARRKARLIREFESDDEVKKSATALAALAKIGEASVSDLDSARRRRHARLHQLHESEMAADAAESELRRLLNLAPGARMDFSALESAVCEHGAMPAMREPLDYTRHWKVKAALARLNAGERELEAQIRKQYPELSIGPAYSREDGNDRFGLTGALTLPFWNRNRKGIAEAEGARDAAFADAVAAWQGVVEDAYAARQRLQRWLDHTPEAGTRSVDEVSRLYRLGEISATEYLLAREEIFDAEILELEWHSEVCLAAEELSKTQIPEKQIPTGEEHK